MDNIELKNYAHIKFMAAIISNADTMRDLTKAYNNSNKKVEFEDMVAKLAGSYAKAFIENCEP